MANALTKPGAASMLGSRSICRRSTSTATSWQAPRTISPWPSAYRATQLLGSSNVRFVLSFIGTSPPW